MIQQEKDPLNLKSNTAVKVTDIFVSRRSYFIFTQLLTPSIIIRQADNFQYQGMPDNIKNTRTCLNMPIFINN